MLLIISFEFGFSIAQIIFACLIQVKLIVAKNVENTKEMITVFIISVDQRNIVEENAKVMLIKENIVEENAKVMHRTSVVRLTQTASQNIYFKKEISEITKTQCTSKKNNKNKYSKFLSKEGHIFGRS